MGIIGGGSKLKKFEKEGVFVQTDDSGDGVFMTEEEKIKEELIHDVISMILNRGFSECKQSYCPLDTVKIRKIFEEFRDLTIKKYKELIGKNIDSHSRKDISHYEDSWDIRPSDLKKELGL